MDFEDSPQEAAFRTQVRDWLEANATRWGDGKRSRARGSDAVARAKRWQKIKADAGYAAITWPKEYGGMGGTPMQNVIYGQEEANFDAPSGLFMVGNGMGMPTLMAHGTQAQKERFIRASLYGEDIWCQLFSEPGAGSDLGGVRTRAEKDGDEWVINGQKIWTSGAHYSDWGILVARSDPSVPKHMGLTYFLLDMKTPGVEVKPITQISGAQHFNEVYFTDVRIPDTMRVGAEGAGWQVALTTLMNERQSIGGLGSSVGVDQLIELARDTELGDGPAIDNMAIRERIADWHIQSEGLKYIRFMSLTAMTRGDTPSPRASISKAVTAQRKQELTAFAVELMDLGGIIRDRELSPFRSRFQEEWISSPALRIAGGTDEIMRNIIAERVLGMPSEIRVDKDIPFEEAPTGL